MAQKKTLNTFPIPNFFSSAKSIPLTQDGLFSTMNKMGYMTKDLDPFSLKFIKLCADFQKPVLDIGAAYGVATIPALMNGATVIANDICDKHLQILQDLVPDKLKDYLITKPGQFPEEITFSSNSLSAVYSARVFHFFKGTKIEESFKKIMDWLEPGGWFFLISETPYLNDYKNFIPVFEKRKQNGFKWPGEIEDISKYNPCRLSNIPHSFNLLDPETVSKNLKEAGFQIIEASYISRSDFPDDLKFDGRESMAVIAKKPFMSVF